ncbi:hypothetical protein H4Q26_013973 [Puccinia striiformis f. sp. tritici PST-130]|nr:hypothetical protein H4Q26_013973 [Puccinia striiformis f. sp. tritici PST-130]
MVNDNTEHILVYMPSIVSLNLSHNPGVRINQKVQSNLHEVRQSSKTSLSEKMKPLGSTVTGRPAFLA